MSSIGKKFAAGSLAAITLALLAGCPATTGGGVVTKVNVYTAPKDAAVTAIRSIAVVPFERDNGEGFSRALENVVANVQLTDKSQTQQKTLTVIGIDRTRAMGRSIADPAKAADAAKSLGVEAFLVGEVAVATATSQPYQDTRQVCARPTVKTDKKGRQYEDCLSYVDQPVPCVKNSSTVTVNYRLVRADGTVISRDSAEAKDEDHACEGKRVKPKAQTGNLVERWVQDIGRQVGGPVATPQELLAGNFRKASEQIRDQLVPGQRSHSVEWMSGTQGLSGASSGAFDGALKFAGAGRADRACEVFRELYVKEKQSVSLHYNAGLCDEVDGQLEAAALKYKIADRMLTEPNKIVSAALERLSKQVKYIEEIAKARPELLDPTAMLKPGSMPGANPIAAASETVPQELRDRLKNERRVALVIGNGAYRNLGALRNATKDARDVEDALKAANFTVYSGYDQNHQQTLQLINRFRTNLRKGDVAVVFFAGHGIAAGDTNLLLPIDFQKDFARDAKIAKTKALDMSGNLTQMMRQAGVRFSMVVADACREIPSIESETRGLARGLKAPPMAAGSLVVFAAGAGQTASDGAGANGLFTKHFLQAIKTPNVPVRKGMEAVAQAVAMESNQLQVPGVYAETVGDFYFAIQ